MSDNLSIAQQRLAFAAARPIPKSSVVAAVLQQADSICPLSTGVVSLRRPKDFIAKVGEAFEAADGEDVENQTPLAHVAAARPVEHWSFAPGTSRTAVESSEPVRSHAPHSPVASQRLQQGAYSLTFAPMLRSFTEANGQ